MLIIQWTNGLIVSDPYACYMRNLATMTFLLCRQVSSCYCDFFFSDWILFFVLTFDDCIAIIVLADVICVVFLIWYMVKPCEWPKLSGF